MVQTMVYLSDLVSRENLTFHSRAVGLNFLLISLIGSIALTAIINVLPVLFPNAAAKAERKISEKIQQTHADRVNPETPKVRVFFPWKAMLMGSLALTVLVNVVGLLAR